MTYARRRPRSKKKAGREDRPDWEIRMARSIFHRSGRRFGARKRDHL